MILDSISSLLPGLLPASYRGVSFHVPDTSTEVGRRVVEHLFPGIDRAAYDDFGRHPADVSIEGMMVGDDYIAQAKRLSAAFERAGPGTLLHPWLGGMTVMLVEPAEIAFSDRELRVARFRARFKKVGGGGGISAASTASQLIGAASSMAAASLSLGASPASAELSSVRTLAAERSWRAAVAAWAPSAGRLASVLARPLGVLAPTAPGAYATALPSITAALIASVGAMRPTPAVSPAGDAAPALDVAPLTAMATSLAAASSLLATEAPAAADRAMLAAGAGDAIATAMRISVHAAYTSRNEAADNRNRICAVVDHLVDSLSELASGPYAAAASTALRSAIDARAALVADINEVIGRLPAVVAIATALPADAYQVANHLYGDDVAAIEAGYLSIVARNRPRHPAYLPAGRIEALK